MNKEKLQGLDSKERLNSLELDKILDIIKIRGDEIILDIGAGTGALSLPIAKQLSSGHLYAYDINSNALKVLEDKIEKENITNITPVLLNPSSSAKLVNVDKIFMCTVLHEILDKDNFINKYKPLLNNSGKMYIVEFADNRRHPDEVNPPEREYISIDDAKELLTSHFDNVEIKKLNDLIYISVCY